MWSYLLTISALPFCSGCGGLISGMGGYLLSPSYPNPYANNLLCTWNITVPSGKVMTLEFYDFDLEESPGCVNDALTVVNHEIIDGDPQRTTTAKYCGSVLPPLLLSSQEKVTMILETNSVYEYRGFNTSFAAVDNPTIQCDQQLTDRQGEITSPYYPAVYPSGIRCETVITAAKITYTIKLTVHDIVTEKRHDTLKVYDGTTKQARIGNYHGEPTVPKVVTSTGNVMTVLFESDYNRRFLGFRATYEVLGIEEEPTTDATTEIFLTSTDSQLTSVNTDGDGGTSAPSIQNSSLSTTTTTTPMMTTTSSSTTTATTTKATTARTDIPTVVTDGGELSTRDTSEHTTADTMTRDSTDKVNFKNNVELHSMKAIVPMTSCSGINACTFLTRSSNTDTVERVDRAQTSRARRKKVCADNYQASARVLGGVALAFVVAFFFLLTFSDISTAIYAIISRFSR